MIKDFLAYTFYIDKISSPFLEDVQIAQKAS